MIDKKTASLKAVQLLQEQFPEAFKKVSEGSGDGENSEYDARYPLFKMAEVFAELAVWTKENLEGVDSRGGPVEFS